jgi:hypothetical protein
MEEDGPFYRVVEKMRQQPNVWMIIQERFPTI